MLWLWILLALVFLAVLLCATRVGVWAAYDGETLRLDARIGLLRIHILPAKPKKAERPPEKRKPRKEPAEKKKGGLSFAMEDAGDALHTMLPPLKRALSRTRRGIQIKPLRLSVVLGGREDPAAAAGLYGKLQAAVWTGMPAAEKFLDIRDPYIHTGVDFETADTAAAGEAGVTFRIGTLLAVGFGLALPALRWFLRWRKRCKTRPPEPEQENRREVPPSQPETPPAA
ncbi:hypothetical protein [uncultured Oscillibacter sp.]|uniref:hypothetical protein n=1 Tax=uncultured Oscillibacter sp. TaxID=876091 RepID=UPI0025DDBB7D|nr:hypothetical protein [uncultured Oscillibacter sp.]